MLTDDVKIPGDWFIRHITTNGEELFGLSFSCCGCGAEGYIPIKTTTEDCRYWEWDGNLEAPTLKQSLLNRCCGWHGHMQVGRWVPQPGSAVPQGANL